MWITGPIEDEFLRLARLLKPETQKHIFEAGFLLRHVREVRTCFDPKLVPAIKDLKQGRCNYPSDLTKRTELWRDRGKARCKKSVRDGVYFCHLSRHKEFALVNGLPLSWEDLPEGTVQLERKPDAEKRGRKVDDEPLRPSFRAHKGASKKKVNAERAVNDTSLKRARDSDEELDDASVDRILQRLLRRQKDSKRVKPDSTNEESSTLVIIPEEPTSDGLNQCAFTDPVSSQACRAIGVYEDAESPCLFCPGHITVPDDLIIRVKKSIGHSQLLRDLCSLQTLDEKIEQLANKNDAVVERKKLCIKRFVLASKNGFGTPPAVLRGARSM